MTRRDLLFATVVLTLYAHWGRGDIPWCSLVEEGASLNVDCSSQIGSDTSYVVWELEKDGKWESISRCSTRVSRCDSSKDNISVSNSHVGGRFNSNMMIKPVTSSFRDSKISCGVWDGKSDRPHPIVLCKMGVYKLGDATHCSATYNSLDDSAVLECVSQYAFLGLSCRMFEKIDGHLTQKNVSMSSKTSNKGGQVQGSCHTVVNIRRPGQYAYDFSVSVTTNSNTSTERTFRTVLKSSFLNIPYPPKVKVLHDKVILCSQKSVQARMTCSVKWLKTEPEFNLTLAGKTLSTLTPTWKYDENDEYKMYTAIGDFSVVRSSKDAMLACDVMYVDGGVRKVANDTKRLQVKWAPETAPKFKVNGSVVLNGFIEASKDDVINIVCFVTGGQPNVYDLNISCADRNGSIFQSASNLSSSVSVIALADSFQGEGSCTCTAEHETNCPKLSSRLFVYVDRPALRSLRGYRDILSGMTPVYYVIFGTLVLLMVPFIIAFGVFLARHGHGLYAVYQGKYRNVNMAVTRERAPRDQDQPPPVPGPRIPPRVANKGASEHTALNNSTDDSDGWEDDNISISLRANPQEVVVPTDVSSAIYNPNEDYLEPLPHPLPPPIQSQIPPPLPPPIQSHIPPPLPPPIQSPVHHRLPSPIAPTVPPLPSFTPLPSLSSTPPSLPPRNESFSTSPIVYTSVFPHQSTTSRDNNDSSHTPLKTDAPPPLPPRAPGPRPGKPPESPRDSLAILSQKLLGSDDEGSASPCSSVGLCTPPARRHQRNGSLKSLNGNEDSLTELMLSSSKKNPNHVH